VAEWLWSGATDASRRCRGMGQPTEVSRQDAVQYLVLSYRFVFFLLRVPRHLYNSMLYREASRCAGISSQHLHSCRQVQNLRIT
jgi:hypothetical protein